MLNRRYYLGLSTPAIYLLRLALASRESAQQQLCPQYLNPSKLLFSEMRILPFLQYYSQPAMIFPLVYWRFWKALTEATFQTFLSSPKFTMLL